MTIVSPAPVLEVQGVIKRFDSFTALAGVDLVLYAGSVHAVIGPNGAGKTTLLQVITGLVRPDAGRILLKDREISRWPSWRRVRAGLGRTFQVAHLFEQMTVTESLRVAAAAQGRTRMISTLRSASQTEQEASRRAMELCELGDLGNQVVGELSHGDRKRVELALVLTGSADVLVLDEPTAGMSRAETELLVALLAKLVRDEGRSLLLIEHDMEVVGRLADHVTALSQGEVVFSGTPTDMSESKELRTAYFGPERVGLD